VQVDARLCVHKNGVATGLYELPQNLFRVLYHKVSYKGQVRFIPYVPYHQRPERDIRNKPAVHNIAVDAVRTCGRNPAHIPLKIAEISGQQGG
jgi:hypothetical protein